MKKTLLLIGAMFIFLSASADEGMWLLKELNRQSAARMKELGFTFPIDSLYSEQNPSLKDAVVIFGGGCTGVAVSQEGLIFTNHHCGYDAIQKHSSVEHDYLKNGFVSQTKAEELYTEGLTVSFLQKTEDVTAQVTTGITNNTSELDRYMIIDSLSNQILAKYKDNEFLNARIVPFYTGNKFYLIVYEVFKDVRMVFAPPSSIGKFGGDTDNWQWPRHTGDFSVFRVYANKDNQATGYSKDNVPYKPKYSVPVSTKGYKDKDYAMTIGYPGSTERYLSSWGIEQMMESENIPRIDVRTVKQDIWREAMNADDAVRIKYAVKFSRSSNYWKNSMGMNQALKKLHVVEGKRELESRLYDWIKNNPNAKEKYGDVLSDLQNSYQATNTSVAIGTYFAETFSNGIEIIRFANIVKSSNITDKEELSAYAKARLGEMYKDYVPELDQKVMPALLKLYAEKVPAKYLPSIYETINKKFKGDHTKYAEWVYKNSKFTDINNLSALIQRGSEKDLAKDPAMILANSIADCRMKLVEDLSPYYPVIDKNSRKYMAALIEMEPNKVFYPDANFTQRLSYGSIGGYNPADAVEYDYYSTTKGILEKENPNSPEFAVQNYILEDLRKEQWGQYANANGTMTVGFLSNNDITGGNSGSPVFNGKAELIGLAFDGNWEALSGDIVFEPELQRTISVDIRYVLYTIDKMMKCPRLIKELELR
ncbi:S46 family peptidase [Dysgonomonas sp. OttesenSCG-928-M03]|nr:S46 family peptidase [Dysgonomonas sp. OttesenSCG-928-M03]